MVILLTMVLLAVLYIFLRFFAVNHALLFISGISLFVSILSTISLWFNYKASFGEQDGIAISNRISYWLITDEIPWSQKLFLNYLITSFILTILIFTLLAAGIIRIKRDEV
jgi:hypothetical protein